jgi:hypothetical protein
MGWSWYQNQQKETEKKNENKVAGEGLSFQPTPLVAATRTGASLCVFIIIVVVNLCVKQT